MTLSFPVEWRRVFKSLSIFMTVTIAVPLTIFVCFRYAASGFDYSKAFEHMSLPVFLVLLLCIPIFSMVFSFLIALLLRLAKITIFEGAIHGRNYWGMKNRIPLGDITTLTPFSNNGINAIVVSSNYHGKIYISDKTQRLPELLEILNMHLPDDQKADEGLDPSQGDASVLKAVEKTPG